MSKVLTFASGTGLGAALAYLLDAQQGKRRRALARDQLIHIMHQAGDAVEPTARDLRNRAVGVLAESRLKLLGGDVPHNVLVGRVRSQMGRHVSHPGSIGVSADDEGHVILRGDILAHELDGLIKAVARTPGVAEVRNELTSHKQPGNIPGLQGGKVPPAKMPAVWPPTTRLLAGTSGSLMMVAGTGRGGALGTFLNLIGMGLLVRAVSNKQMKQLVGVDVGRRAVDVQKTINVSAPVEEVYAFWSDFENFPKFMTHIREVQNLDNGRSHWVVIGPGGVSVNWDAVITRQEENKLLSWRSEPGATVASAGTVHFTANAEGGTQVQVQMSYNPPVGAIGHSVAALLGSDPKAKMDEDLVRFKTLIETGKTTVNGRTVKIETLPEEQEQA
jgi:uncharacterized membrane protein